MRIVVIDGERQFPVDFVYLRPQRLGPSVLGLLAAAINDAMEQALMARERAAPPEPVLCYVDGGFAWFTTAPLDRQGGDDWDDAPYESNAGEPYAWRGDVDRVPEYHLTRLAFEGPFDQPDAWHLNSPWSVDDINAGKVAWLAPARFGVDHGVSIFAGCTPSEFTRLVQAAGGTVYAPVEVVPAPVDTR